MYSRTGAELDKCAVGQGQSWINVGLGGGRVGQMCSRSGAELDKCGIGRR